MIEKDMIDGINKDIEQLGFSDHQYHEVISLLARNDLMNIAQTLSFSLTHVINNNLMEGHPDTARAISKAKSKFKDLCVNNNWAIEQKEWDINQTPIRITKDKIEDCMTCEHLWV